MGWLLSPLSPYFALPILPSAGSNTLSIGAGGRRELKVRADGGQEVVVWPGHWRLASRFPGWQAAGGAFWRFFAGVFSAVSPAGPLTQETESLFPLGSDGSLLTLCPSDFTSRPFPLKSLHLLCGHPRPDEDGRLSAPPTPCPSSSPQEAPVGPFALTDGIPQAR